LVCVETFGPDHGWKLVELIVQRCRSITTPIEGSSRLHLLGALAAARLRRNRRHNQRAKPHLGWARRRWCLEHVRDIVCAQKVVVADISTLFVAHTAQC